MKKLIKTYGAFNVIMIASIFYGLITAAIMTQVCPGFNWFTYNFAGFFNNIKIMTTTMNGLIATSIMVTVSFATGLLAGKYEAQQ